MQVWFFSFNKPKVGPSFYTLFASKKYCVFQLYRDPDSKESFLSEMLLFCKYNMFLFYDESKLEQRTKVEKNLSSKSQCQISKTCWLENSTKTKNLQITG
jgi:hypothetical protein